MSKVLPKLEAPKSLNERVFEALSDAIVLARFKPGEPLVVVEVAEQLGVSRTPVRVALGQLEQLGLLQTVEGQRYAVAPLSSEDLDNLYTLREVLEGLAARLAAQKASGDQLEELAQQMEKTRSLMASNSLNELQHPETFHQIILEAASNEQLAHALRRISLHVQRYRHMAIAELKSDLLRDGMSEHDLILEALSVRDEKLAEKRMRDHIAHARERLMSRWKLSDKVV
jgi:DNA-binding GntR family transcriptional regulator